MSSLLDAAPQASASYLTISPRRSVVRTCHLAHSTAPHSAARCKMASKSIASRLPAWPAPTCLPRANLEGTWHISQVLPPRNSVPRTPVLRYSSTCPVGGRACLGRGWPDAGAGQARRLTETRCPFSPPGHYHGLLCAARPSGWLVAWLDSFERAIWDLFALRSFYLLIVPDVRRFWLVSQALS